MNQRELIESLRGMEFLDTFTSLEQLKAHLEPLAEAVGNEDWDSVKKAIREIEKDSAGAQIRGQMELIVAELSDLTKPTKAMVEQELHKRFPGTVFPSRTTMTEWWKMIGHGDLDQDRSGR